MLWIIPVCIAYPDFHRWNSSLAASPVKQQHIELTTAGQLPRTKMNNAASGVDLHILEQNFMPNSVFTFIKTNPFGLNDSGTLSTPTFADIDHDGDQDAFVGDGFGGLYFYRNTGTAINPTFAAAIKNPFGFNNASFYTRPDFVDIDNDGDLDAFVGNFDGITQFYRNTGTLTNPAFAAAVNNPFGLGDVGLQASPIFVDIDNDGDQDAFIGNLAGNILFSRNTGTVSAPAFAAAITNPFGLTNVGAQANPAFLDSDGDGDLDLLLADDLVGARGDPGAGHGLVAADGDDLLLLGLGLAAALLDAGDLGGAGEGAEREPGAQDRGGSGHGGSSIR